jgi:hypothetical protein
MSTLADTLGERGPRGKSRLAPTRGSPGAFRDLRSYSWQRNGFRSEKGENDSSGIRSIHAGRTRAAAPAEARDPHIAERLQEPSAQTSPALRFANAISMIALFVALSSGAYALGGKNSVKSDDIKDGQVKSKDLKNDDVRSGDIEDGSLTGSDINESTLAGLPVPEGPTEMAAEQGMTVFTSDTAFDLGDGSIVYECAGAPSLTYSNDSGASALVVSSRRSVVFEDDGVAGNGELGVSGGDVLDGDEESVSVVGAGGFGRAEMAIATDDELIYVELYSRVLTECDYVAIMTREAR